MLIFKIFNFADCNLFQIKVASLEQQIQNFINYFILSTSNYITIWYNIAIGPDLSQSYME